MLVGLHAVVATNVVNPIIVGLWVHYCGDIIMDNDSGTVDGNVEHPIIDHPQSSSIIAVYLPFWDYIKEPPSGWLMGWFMKLFFGLPHYTGDEPPSGPAQKRMFCCGIY